MKRVRRAVIFDLYGTLVDLQVNEDSPLFWDALAAGARLAYRPVSGEQLSGTYRRLIQEAAAHSSEGFMIDTVFSGLLQELGIEPAPETIRLFAEKFRRLSTTHLTKKAYTDDLLGAIRVSGYKLGLISNTEALLTDYDLKVSGLEDRFDAIVLSSSVGVKKPDRRIFEIALGRLGVKPGDCAFVGDNFADDIGGAAGAGIDAVFLAASTKSLPLGGDETDRLVVRAGFDLGEIVAALRRIGFAISLI